MQKLALPFNSPMQQKDFLYGVATASFQIEGSADSRLPCIWDTFCATPNKIADASDGLIACDHVNRWQEDLDIIESLGVDAYRFSISWPRVIKEDGSLNQEGANFYIQLLDQLKSKNIKSYVTLYHWDLPQHLEDNGGWLNRETAYKYAEYVDLITKALGNRVHSYATFNEPYCSAFLGYEIGVHAPGKVGRKHGRTAAHHILLAHGLGMQVLQKNSPDTINGIVLNFTPCYPVSQSKADLAATQLANQYINLWYLQPLMEKSYPAIIDLLDENDKPDIHPGDLDIIGHKIDFLGVNFYTRLTYSAPTETGSFYTEHEHLYPRTDIGWEIFPQALTDYLVELDARFSLPPIYITENGAAMADKLENGQVHDTDRVNYYDQHLNALHKAIDQGVNIKGYFAWSLIDNFEWAEGYLKRFGLVHVDYKTQKRTLKDSAKAYQTLLASRIEQLKNNKK
ncbi:GH1 family beta-glucosidase [Glaciecola petra]|uniref:Beta-glucosidase n=1 Tax=Glaciecola petra TaxID=3075602 RepID=A0ABU2ZTT1_9ALTE|nr:GH1 family beta-glucosidase [Aestuariibacter sp. P117]MDT0596053.1 GH1 family beta-glucosidase [Aestuariibacter sp. P117]